MKVILGGYNIDAETIKDLAGKGWKDVTPEVISASYARISRDPRNVGLLRKEARREVDRARKSNRSIVFGLGHSSVAEHAVFNIDVMDVSRLAVEAIEHFRLASFTEKSQRYIRLGRDFVIPDEIAGTRFEGEFGRLMDHLAAAYEELHECITAAGKDEETAKEDARYLMPLATTAQFGMTVNARELEYMISRLSSHPLAELREFASKLYDAAGNIAPSLIKYPDPTEYFRSADSVRDGIEKAAGKRVGAVGKRRAAALLIDVTDKADVSLAAGLIFSSTDVSYEAAMKTAASMSTKRRTALIKSTMKGMKLHDGVWREFEKIKLLYELTVSSSCFAQLKRHRMATIIAQRYSPRLGISVPESVRRAGKVRLLRDAAAMSERLYRSIRPHDRGAAEYALLNAHMRRVLFDLNLRELYHFSRLRSDKHAQWEIRRVSEEMCALASEAVPSGSLLLSGKDSFERLSRELLD